MRLRPVVGQPGSSNFISRVKLRQTTVQLRKMMMMMMMMIIHGTVYGAVVVTQVIARVHSVHLMNEGQRQTAADPQTGLTDLYCESAYIIIIIIIIQLITH